MTPEPPTVLIVEDEPDLADLYAAWLDEEYDVRTAYGGHEALELFDDDVDVVLLDRRMPDMPGDEVLEAIRADGGDCRVAMVTAVEPDFDIIAMGFDDYLVKPVAKDDLHRTVTNLLRRDEYEGGVQELFALTSKKALLEAEKSPAELETHEEYRELADRVDELRDSLDATLDEFSEESDVAHLYRDIGRDPN
jgi:DNA-binding response OmpR family regulator